MNIPAEMAKRLSLGSGFFAALDQSGGSTPSALRAYGVPDTAYHDSDEMFRLMHAMRVRIMTAPVFTGERILGAILFEGTMDGTVEDDPVPHFLWKERGIVPFVKIDKGLEPEQAGVQMMKPIPDLESTLKRAVRLGVFGTKARSVIHRASAEGIDALVSQQFALAEQVARHGLLPIVEPEVLIASPDKADCEATLQEALARRLDALPGDRQVVLKLTLPEQPDFYRAFLQHDRVARVVALSGGYSRDEACRRLEINHGVIASFSRALVGDLRLTMSDSAFDAVLEAAISQIYRASVLKA